MGPIYVFLSSFSLFHSVPLGRACHLLGTPTLKKQTPRMDMEKARSVLQSRLYIKRSQNKLARVLQQPIHIMVKNKVTSLRKIIMLPPSQIMNQRITLLISPIKPLDLHEKRPWLSGDPPLFDLLACPRPSLSLLNLHLPPLHDIRMRIEQSPFEHNLHPSKGLPKGRSGEQQVISREIRSDSPPLNTFNERGPSVRDFA